MCCQRINIVIAAIVILLSFFNSSTANNMHQNPDNQRGRDVREFLTPDGRINLEAIKASGYQGPLNIEGCVVDLDSLTREPVFQSSKQDTKTNHPDDIYWDNNMSPCIPGVGGVRYYKPVSALAVYKDMLIVGGHFIAAGCESVLNIACWDGIEWSSLGSGVNGCGVSAEIGHG